MVMPKTDEKTERANKVSQIMSMATPQKSYAGFFNSPLRGLMPKSFGGQE